MRLSNLTTKTQRHKGSTKKITFFFVLSLRLCVFVVGLFMCNVAANAQSPNEIVERAIKAHGGSSAVAKLKAFERSGKGKCTVVGSEVAATYEAKLALPDRAHFTIEMSLPAAKVKTVIGLNGLSGWVRANNDPPKDLASSQFDLMADEAWVHWLCTVGPLTTKNLTLAAVPQIQIEGQPADGIRVTKEGRPEALLYFAKSNNLLVKAQSRIKDSGTAVNKEWNFAAHKDFSGVQLPTKITEMQNGVRQAEWISIEYKFVDKFDLATFRKP